MRFHIGRENLEKLVYLIVAFGFLTIFIIFDWALSFPRFLSWPAIGCTIAWFTDDYWPTGGGLWWKVDPGLSKTVMKGLAWLTLLLLIGWNVSLVNYWGKGRFYPHSPAPATTLMS
jgi:hypothetical protein